MNILIVCRRNNQKISPFIEDQVDFLRKEQVKVDYFFIEAGGIKGYLKSYFRYISILRKSDYKLVHAHYGFSGLFAALQFRKPVVTTFHGSDINLKKNRKFSAWAHRLSAFSVFVKDGMPQQIKARKKLAIIPCGVDLATFKPQSKAEARKHFNLDPEAKIGLFTSSFENAIKNAPLAKSACEKIEGLTLMELKGYGRAEVSRLINACDFLLMTSFSEGSPQIVKETMACNRPVVSTDVGDVRQLFGQLDGHYITTYDADDIAVEIRKALNFTHSQGETGGRNRIVELELDNVVIAKRLIGIYQQL